VAPVEGDGLPSEQNSRLTGAAGPAALEIDASELPAERLDVAAVAPASDPTSPDVSTVAGDGTSTSAQAHAPPEAPRPWQPAADAASAIGRESRKGAIKTAGFFTRIGKSVAGAF
jgi:hypothetical protein